MTDEEQTARIQLPIPLIPARLAACLVVLSGAAAGRVIKLEKPRISLGRSTTCDVVLDDEGVSRRHATIVNEDGAYFFEDHSTNGSWLNGARLGRHELRTGEQIQLAATTVLKFSLQDELERRVQTHLYEAAVRDLLTQLHNRRYFEEELVRAVSHATRHDAPLSVLLIDIDHFKRINDQLGHAAGDHVLREVAARCRRAVRNEDVLCRIGGEELAVIARSTPWQNALILGQRLRRSIGDSRIRYGGEELAVSVSIGVAGLGGEQRTPGTLLAAADGFLYQAKQRGRNAVCGPEL